MSEVNDIIERINAAIVRIAQGHAPMRIPADAHSDADIVLGDAATEIARLRAELEEARRERKALLERCAEIVRNAAAHHGLCCADCESLADVVMDLGA